MKWRALSRLVIVRLLLLVAIAAAGPAGVASSWHSLDSVEHRLGLPSDSTLPAFEAGALPPEVSAHCPACEFGTALRVWTPTPTTTVHTPVHHVSRVGTPSATPLHTIASDPHAGRAPPRRA